MGHQRVVPGAGSRFVVAAQIEYSEAQLEHAQSSHSRNQRQYRVVRPIAASIRNLDPHPFIALFANPGFDL